MDEMILDIFKNSHKSKLSKKDFDEIPVRDSQKVVGSSKKVAESTLSIGKNLDEPKSSDAFRNLMKGVFEMGKRIDDKYSTKNIDQPPTSSKKILQKQNNKWKPDIDKIKQQKNQDDEHNKQDIGVGTSQQNLPNPYLQSPPMRIISPEGSRIVAGPDNSRIIFPPQIVQMRPLSPSSRYQMPVNSRIIVSQPAPPGRVLIRQPINRQPTSPTKIVSYSPPPQRVSQSPPTHVRFIYPQTVPPTPTPTPTPTPVQYIQQQPIPVHYLQHSLQPLIQNNYPVYYPMPQTQPNQQIYPQYPLYPHPQQYPQYQHQNEHQYPANSTAHLENNSDQKTQQKQPKTSGNSSPPAAQNPSKSMTPEQYQALLQKQYQMYNSQNSELMKHLSQLTEQQKKQYANQQLLQQVLKNSKNVKNVINQKRVTKIVQKNIVNKQNIQNVENIRNQVNMCNVSNQFNMQNVQNLQNFQAIQYLQQLYGNDPKMLNNQILLKQLEMNMGITSQSAKRLALQETGNKSLINISSKNLLPGGSLKKVQAQPPPLPTIPLEQQITQQKIQKQIFTEGLQRDIDKLDIFQDTINMDYHISDLSDIKTQNIREGMSYLKKMDELLDRYSQKPAKELDTKISVENKQDTNSQNLMSKLLSNIFTTNQSKQPDPILVQSVISPLPETHTKIPSNQNQQQEEKQKQNVEQSGKKSKHFLSLTKDMVVDFISGLV